MTILIVLGIAMAVGMLVMPTGLVINTGLLTRNARSEFLDRFNSTPSHYQRLSMRIQSNRDQENYRWLGSVPRMREWGNGRLAQGLRSESFDVENLKYEATIEVDRDELADDQTGQIRIRIGELAQRAATHKDYLIAQLLINGATAGYLCYDGGVFFSTTHSSGSSGNQDNAKTFTAAATTKTTTECRGALQQAIESMLSFRDDQGEPMVYSRSGLVALVPPSMYTPMAEAASAAVISSTTNVLAGLCEVIPFPWLTAGTTWYLLKTDGVVKPFAFQDREPIEFNSLAENSEEEFKREKYLYGVRARYNMAYAYWQYCVRTVFSN